MNHIKNNNLLLKIKIQTFLGSLTRVTGHCISLQVIGTIFTPGGALAALAITTPKSGSAVDN